MARVVLQVVVEREVDDGCDACWKKDETARQSVVEFTLDGRTWYLCEEHEHKLAGEMVGLLGEGTKESEGE